MSRATPADTGSRSRPTEPGSRSTPMDPGSRSTPTEHGSRSTLVRFWPAIAILALFALSVLVRLPSLGLDPIASQGWTAFERFNNTEVWDHNRYVLEVYSALPVSEHRFVGYIGASDEFLKNADNPALTVYTSFPPAHFIVLFLASTLVGGTLTYGGAQILGLVLHALCVALVGYLIHLLTRNNVVTVVGAAMYTFSTGTLWYHMNVFWAHELLVPVFLVALIVFVRRQGRLRWWEGLLLGLALSIVTWTGAVAAVGFALYGAWQWYRTRDTAYLGNVFMVAGMVVAVALIVGQVLITTGASPMEYLEKVANRAGSRSAGAETVDLPVTSWRFVNALVLDYGGFMLIALVLAARRKLTGFQWGVAAVAAFPLLESFLLLEHDLMYGFGRLKWLLPAILIACMAGANLSPRGKWKLGIATGVAALVHIGLYFVIFDTGV